MQGSKLVQILATFTDANWKRLRNVVSSPVYSSQKYAATLLALLAVIRKVMPDTEHPALSKDTLAKRLHPELEPKKATARLVKLMSHCTRLVERSLLIDDDINSLALGRALQERGLSRMAAQQLAKFERELNEHPVLLKHELYQYYELAEAQMAIYSAESPAKVVHYLQTGEQRLDEWYLLAKLEQVVWQLAQRIQVDSPEKPSLIPLSQLLSWLQPEVLVNYPVHQLYYYAVLFLRAYPAAATEDFHQLSATLEKSGHLLEDQKRKALQTLLRIFAANKYSRGEEAYLPITLKLYEHHLNNGDLYFDHKIHSQTLLNLVTLGVRSGRFAWVDELLIRHDNRILDQNAASQALGLCRALWHFYQQEYETAQDYLMASYDNLYYRLTARRLEIMIYAEQRSVLLESKIEAFKVYIFRLSQKQLPDKPKALNNNFVDMLRQILHPSTLGNEKRLQRLREKVAQTELLAEREWLLRQLD